MFRGGRPVKERKVDEAADNDCQQALNDKYPRHVSMLSHRIYKLYLPPPARQAADTFHLCQGKGEQLILELAVAISGWVHEG